MAESPLFAAVGAHSGGFGGQEAPKSLVFSVGTARGEGLGVDSVTRAGRVAEWEPALRLLGGSALGKSLTVQKALQSLENPSSLVVALLLAELQSRKSV